MGSKPIQSYNKLLKSIGVLLQQARQKAFKQVNNILVKTYWEIGMEIIKYENAFQEKGGYGSKTFEKIARDLKSHYGKGFSRSNVIYMRLLYLYYQKSQTLSDQLSWSHYIEILGVSDRLARSFYEKECLLNHWSVRELRRQIDSMLFERLSLSKDKKGVFKLGSITHQDIGQMNLYLNYFKKEEMNSGDNEPIGIVLGAEKDQILVEYALGGISNKLFASKYQFTLPDKTLLQATIEQSFR